MTPRCDPQLVPFSKFSLTNESCRGRIPCHKTTLGLVHLIQHLYHHHGYEIPVLNRPFTALSPALAGSTFSYVPFKPLFSLYCFINMDHIMMVEPKSFEAIAVSFASGCLLHILFYRKGEWDLLALRIFQAYATLPIIVIGLLRLAEFKGWQHDTNLSAVSVLLLEGAHILGLLTSILCYRMIFHPLNKFPGPLRARISNFYPTYLTTKNAHLYEEVEQLHQKYGDFVRLGQYPPFQLLTSN